MELSDVINLSSTISATVGLLIGANYAEYGKVKKWLREHGNADYPWYEEKIEKKGFSKKFDYYLLYPGRKIAYLEHAQERDSKISKP